MGVLMVARQVPLLVGPAVSQLNGETSEVSGLRSSCPHRRWHRSRLHPTT